MAHRARRAPLGHVLPARDAHAAANRKQHRARALAAQNHQMPPPGREWLVQRPVQVQAPANVRGHANESQMGTSTCLSVQERLFKQFVVMQTVPHWLPALLLDFKNVQEAHYEEAMGRYERQSLRPLARCQAGLVSCAMNKRTATKREGLVARPHQPRAAVKLSPARTVRSTSATRQRRIATGIITAVFTASLRSTRAAVMVTKMQRRPQTQCSKPLNEHRHWYTSACGRALCTKGPAIQRSRRHESTLYATAQCATELDGWCLCTQPHWGPSHQLKVSPHCERRLQL